MRARRTPTGCGPRPTWLDTLVKYPNAAEGVVPTLAITKGKVERRAIKALLRP
jgi:hypothetical protein